VKINKTSFKNEFVIIFLVIFFISIFFLKNFNLNILYDDLREEIFTIEPGFSRWHNIIEPSKDGISRYESLVINFGKTLWSKFFTLKEVNELEEMKIDISFENYQSILNDRKNAIENRILINPIQVPATITFQGNKFKAKIRLKGDFSDHWLAKKRLSLRVNLKGKSTIFGLNKFSIQKPRTRSYPHDAVFQKIASKNKILSTEHNYVNVVVNGENWGAMNLESFVSSEYLERNRKKDSIVVRFSDEDGWYYKMKTPDAIKTNYLLSDPLLFSKNYSPKKKFDLHKRKIYSYIIEQRINRNPNLFDVDSYTKLLILSNIWGDLHSLYENNLKHYFNPYTLKLEPISSDQFHPKKINPSDKDSFNNLFSVCQSGYAFLSKNTYESVINNKDFASNFDKNFYEVVKSFELIEDLYKDEQKFFPMDLKYKMDILNSNLDIPQLKANIKKIIFPEFKQINNKEEFSLMENTLISHIKPFHYSNGEIRIYNLLPASVEIIGVRLDKSKVIEVNSEIEAHNMSYQFHKIDTNLEGFLDNRIEIITKFEDEIRYHNTGISLVPNVDNPLISEQTHDYSFLQKNKDSWTIKKGSWLIDKPIFLKSNLIIQPGTKLSFSDKSYIAINGAIFARGTDKEKISFSANNNSWKGIFVFNAGEKSILDNLEISGTEIFEDGIVKLTGGVNFYRSDVDIVNSVFSHSFGEDMLNIVDSKFNISNVIFTNAYSDAFDSDFSHGKIINTRVEFVGGDGIDTSGSIVSIKDFSSKNVYDKSISVGEKSFLDLDSCNILKSGVGVASKDGSIVNIQNCNFSDNKLYDVMTYQKKNFYEPPVMTILNSSVNSFSKQDGTSMLVNNNDVQSTKIDIDDLYKNSFMNKKR